MQASETIGERLARQVREATIRMREEAHRQRDRAELIAGTEPGRRRAAGQPQPFYWRDDRGHLNCAHGVILHGVACTRCEREKDGAIDMPIRPPRAA